MKIDIDQKDFGTLCLCAIRYCQGRETYMPGLVRKICEKYFDKISDKDLKVMIEDCGFQRRMNLYGDEMIDKPSWLAWETKLHDEARKRGLSKNSVK